MCWGVEEYDPVVDPKGRAIPMVHVYKPFFVFILYHDIPQPARQRWEALVYSLDCVFEE
jgi:hypothetical protein